MTKAKITLNKLDRKAIHRTLRQTPLDSYSDGRVFMAEAESFQQCFLLRSLDANHLSSQFSLFKTVPLRRWKVSTSNLAEPNLGHPNVNPAIPVLYPNLGPTKHSGRQTIFLFLSGELTFNNIKSPRTRCTYLF